MDLEFTDQGPIIDREYLLARVTEEDIFTFYLHLEVKTGFHFLSPLRKDHKPTCSFKYGTDGRPRFKDWAHNTSVDCFDLVGKMFRLGYTKTIQKIAYDMGLSDIPVDAEKQELHNERSTIGQRLHQRSVHTINVSTKDLTKADLAYFDQFGIGRDTLSRYWVGSVGTLWLDNKQIHWGSDSDPGICYYFGNDKTGRELWKIYFYKRDTHRFLCNTSRLQGFLQLPESGDRVIITKSMKDVMTLHELEIPAIAPQGETVVIKRPVINILSQRFKEIYSLYDWDITGVQAAQRLRKEFDIPSIFTHKWGAKDVSDLVKSKGMLFVADLVEEFINRANRINGGTRGNMLDEVYGGDGDFPWDD